VLVPPSYSIRLNEAASQFELPIDGHLAFAEFSRAPGEITYFHTLVPHELEGHGVGSALVRHILDYAQQQKLQVHPTCSFVRAYIERHPQYQALLEPQA
jgi:predicted GNAT family acetyltransferase